MSFAKRALFFVASITLIIQLSGCTQQKPGKDTQKQTDTTQQKQDTTQSDTAK
jgi:hypothetical protein